MHRKLLCLLAVGLLLPSASASAADPVISRCLVTLTEGGDLTLPAREPGPLVAMEAKEGMQVKKDTTIGRIDDSESTAQKRIKYSEYKAAQETAKTDIEVRFAEAATEVAKAELEISLQANRRTRGAVTDVDISRLRLTAKKSELSIDKAQVERRVAALTAGTKWAEVEAAEFAIQRRTLKAPFDGIVVKVYRHVGEWVAPGDPVLRIVDLEHLRVEGSIEAAKYTPEEIEGCKVSVEVQLPHRTKPDKFTGKIIFASPLVQVGEYQVVAEVKNRTADGTESSPWVLRPGLNAKMTIYLGSRAGTENAAQK